MCTEPAPKCPAGMIGIGAASFYGGTNRSDEVCQKCPEVHEVKLAAFCIDRAEVTVEAYKRCVDAGKCSPPKPREEGRAPECNELLPERMQHPVNCIDWNQASAYCAFVGGRLPTEDEWLFAAGRGEGRRYPWGQSSPGPGVANLFGGDGEHDRPLFPEYDGWEFTAPVGAFPRDKSPFGLLDMGGNVSEWASTKSGQWQGVLTMGGDHSAGQRGILSALRFRGAAPPALAGPALGARCVKKAT